MKETKGEKNAGQERNAGQEGLGKPSHRGDENKIQRKIL